MLLRLASTVPHFMFNVASHLPIPPAFQSSKNYRGYPAYALIPSVYSTDRRRVKPLFLFALSITMASAESHPTWWMYASPEATALVGIHWDNLRSSPFGAAVAEELASTGPLAFPDLDCLRHAREIVISAPDLLAAEAGTFPAAIVSEQSQRAGMHRILYRGVTLWITDKPTALGVAQISEQLVLVGTRKTLQSAIDRSMVETGRQYSGLLPRAARFSQTGDLWVVAQKLPDPLASLFVPLDAEAWGFEGQVSVRDGLTVEAFFDAKSFDAAAEIASDLREQAPTFPPIARGLQASSEHGKVSIQLLVSQDELSAALHPAPPKPSPQSTASGSAAVAKVAPAALPATPAPVAVVVPPPPEPKPTGPQIIRIIGLDDGPREIRLPPVP
jgi:hypothetical protein